MSIFDLSFNHDDTNGEMDPDDYHPELSTESKSVTDLLYTSLVLSGLVGVSAIIGYQVYSLTKNYEVINEVCDIV